MDKKPRPESKPGQLDYWAENKRVLLVLLSVWAVAALGSTVVFTDWLDQFTLGGFRLGFWFNQQGAILVFVAIIFIYHFWMSRIEQRYASQEHEGSSQDGSN